MEPTDPISTGPNAAAPQGTTDQNNAEQGNPNEGVQKRINELTARFHSAEGRAEELAKQNALLVQQLAEGMTRREAPVEQEPQLPEGMDPAAVAYLDKMLQRIEARQNQMFQKLGAEVGASRARQAGAAHAQLVGDKTGWVENRAAELYVALKAKGLPINEEDAGMYAMAEFIKNGGSRGAQGSQYTPPVAPQFGGVPPVVTAPRTSAQPLPSNFDQLSPAQKIAELQKRGVDDIPF